MANAKNKFDLQISEIEKFEEVDGRAIEHLADRTADAARHEETSAFTRFVSADGLASLIEAGQKNFAEVTGHALPYNLSRGAGRERLVRAAKIGDIGRGGRHLTLREADGLISHAARMGGWLRAAAELPAVRQLLQKTQYRGVNSDYTPFSLAALVAKYPSPGALERKLQRVIGRTLHILQGYEGQRPSWKHIGMALMCHARVGKAAVIATAFTLGFTKEFTGRVNYQSARTFLVDLHLCKVEVETEAACGFRQAEPVLEKMGIAVHRIAIPIYSHAGFQVGVEFACQVQAVGHPIHLQYDIEGMDKNHVPRYALQETLRSWRKAT